MIAFLCRTGRHSCLGCLRRERAAPRFWLKLPHRQWVRLAPSTHRRCAARLVPPRSSAASSQRTATWLALKAWVREPLVSFAEMTTLVGSAGVLTLPAAAVTLTGDLIGLAWIQTRMVLIIAALHGHDPRDPARVKELLILSGVYGAGPATMAADAAAAGGQRVGKRLLLRYLKGDALRNLTQLFRYVGINVSRAGLIRGLPLVNMPVNAIVNDRATAALGRRAQKYYSTLPSI